MNKAITIKSKFKDYTVDFKNDLSFLKDRVNLENALFVIDQNVYDLYMDEFDFIPEERLMCIVAKEENKVLDTALTICEKITTIDAKRNAILVSIGGGIIQDITGLVANITYRGIHWIFVPTTLLSACDSCIGGKTSLNYKKYKNLLGTFYPPDEIYICSSMFKTLTERDYKSGLGEVVKFNIMKGNNGLSNIQNNINSLLNRDPEVIDKFVASSLDYKKTFIEIDEFDRGERIKLNFAHTFGHAIEVITNYEIPHGTAVAIGMIMANHISNIRGLLSDYVVEESENLLLKIIDIDISLLDKPLSQYLEAIRKDKKQTNKNLTCVLISSYGDEAQLRVVNDLKEKEVEYAIKYFIALYKGEISRVL